MGDVGGADKRTEPRFKASLPIEVGSDGGLTIDLSSSGIAFESGRNYAIGEEVNVRLQLSRADSPWPMSLECRGRVVRTEERDGVYMIAATVEWIEKEAVAFED